MPERPERWVEMSCGCRYLLALSPQKLVNYEIKEEERCEQHQAHWSYVLYLCARPRRREQMMKRLEHRTQRYIRIRMKEVRSA